jgi:branched-chain amino acid transport system permease protein
MSSTSPAPAAVALVRRYRSPLWLGRAVYSFISDYFTPILLVGLAACVVAVFLKGYNQTTLHGIGGWSGSWILGGETIRNALVIGAIYALVAVGYTMVYGIIELINFAHGDVFTLGAFYALQADRWLNLTSWSKSGPLGLAAALVTVLVFTMLATGLTGVLIEFVAYRPLRHKPRVTALITAIGVSFLLEGIIQVIWGVPNVPTHKDQWVTGIAFAISGVDFSWHAIVVVVTAVAIMLSLQAFVRRTNTGRAMRATAQDRDAAQLSGININRTISLTFFIGSAIAGAGAIIYSINYGSIQWQLGFHLGIIAFTAAVLGGIGNITGAGLGAFLIGAIYVLSGELIVNGGEWSESVIFAMLVIILTFRPTGILGSHVSDRA